MTVDNSPRGLISLYSELGRALFAYDNRTDTLASISRLVVDRVPRAEWASVTEGRNGRFTTVAATDDRARLVDQIQYDVGTGPCVDAILQDTVFRTEDLRQDRRWPTFAQKAAETSDVRSMLSFRLFVEDDERVAGLNIYSTRTEAFDDGAEVVGTLIATHGALAVQVATARDQAAQFQRALYNSRDIGVAMGVLMSRHKVTRGEAFDLLRLASQNTNRKLADIAVDVADSGSLDLPGNWNAEQSPPHRRRQTPRPRG